MTINIKYPYELNEEDCRYLHKNIRCQPNLNLMPQIFFHVHQILRNIHFIHFFKDIITQEGKEYAEITGSIEKYIYIRTLIDVKKYMRERRTSF